MLHVGKYSVDMRVWIAVIPCGGDGVLVGNECCRCRDIIQASRWLVHVVVVALLAVI